MGELWQRAQRTRDSSKETLPGLTQLVAYRRPTAVSASLPDDVPDAEDGRNAHNTSSRVFGPNELHEP